MFNKKILLVRNEETFLVNAIKNALLDAHFIVVEASYVLSDLSGKTKDTDLILLYTDTEFEEHRDVMVYFKDLCVDIAKSLNMNQDDVELSALCGLLHDIGRFEQWKRYGTYNDSQSVDHGDLGAELLKERDLINAFSMTNHNTILNAVKNHNKYRVPQTLDDRDKLFTDVTRDADKIDILYLFAEGFLTSRLHGAAISESVYQSLMKQENICTRAIKTKADVVAFHLAFVFDLNSTRSFEIVKENDYVDKMIDRSMGETTNAELKTQLENLRKHIDRYVADKTRR